MDLDKNLILSTASFGAFVSIDNINIDVGVVINDYHCHLRGEGAGYSSKSTTTVMYVMLAMTAMAPQLARIMNRKLQPDSNVMRIHILHIMKGSHAMA